MSGDPKVLAGLQQAYLASDAAMFASRRAMIRYAWRAETGTSIHDAHSTDAAIRSWTPPPAEPSLDDFAFGLSIKFAELSVELDALKKRLDALEQHPEPTAPDLDPVRVEAAAKAAYVAVYPGAAWGDLWPVAKKARIETANRIIRAYLKDGGA